MQVRSAWLQFREARDAAAAAVEAAIRDGSSRPVGEGLPWDHSHIDAETLLRAALTLESFPSLDAPPPSAVAAAPDASGASPVRASLTRSLTKRMSLGGGAAAADGLAGAARRLVSLREKLKAEAWTDVHKAVADLPGEELAVLPELAADEVRRVTRELQDMASHYKEALLSALATGRSVHPKSGRGSAASVTSPPKRPDRSTKSRKEGKADSAVGGLPLVWDHSALTTEPLEAAMAAMAAFPIQAASAATLHRQATLVLSLRTLLLRCDWGGLSAALDAISEPEDASLEDVTNARAELDDMRAAYEAELQTATRVSLRAPPRLSRHCAFSVATCHPYALPSLPSLPRDPTAQMGGSIKVIGAKTVVHSGSFLSAGKKDFYNAISWDHSGMEMGHRRLTRALAAVEAFPKPSEASVAARAHARLLLDVRGIIMAGDHDALGLPSAQMEPH